MYGFGPPQLGVGDMEKTSLLIFKYQDLRVGAGLELTSAVQ